MTDPFLLAAHDVILKLPLEVFVRQFCNLILQIAQETLRKRTRVWYNGIKQWYLMAEKETISLISFSQEIQGGNVLSSAFVPDEMAHELCCPKCQHTRLRNYTT
ncbi:hypothetical protein [Paenibacillus humicus]|uniref:hypothetical protein n=1 Tax=Paenibacillus humicus TaxID=412861 RepID=UPI003D2AB15B